MVRLILIIIRKIRIISIYFVKFLIFTVISIHFVKFQIFNLISIRFINFQIITSISIHIARKLKILRVHMLWLLYPNYNIKKFYVRKLFCWHITPLNFTKQESILGYRFTVMRTRYTSRYIKLNLVKPDKFAF